MVDEAQTQTDHVARKRDVDPDEWLRRMRHSAAHVLAQIVVREFPDAKFAIGPPIDTGFYYDFLLPRPLTPDDLESLTKAMRKEMKRRHRFVWRPVGLDEARTQFADQPFKLELIDEFSADSDEVGICTHADFTDLCRGGHVSQTGDIGPFKLTSVAGAYWRGDENKPQLQRIYGALFATQEELDAHFARIEEAIRRDHRKIGRELKLFTFSDDIGAGIPLFLPKGEFIRHTMEQFVRDLQTQRGFQHVWTGHLAKGQLYKRSGHLDNYSDAMFPPMVDGETEYYLKPMNCPSHMTLYNTDLHSYRELPLRYSEFATLYRYEKSGELSGLTRVRALTQDDCHIFCTPDQVQSEFALSLDLIRTTLDTYGLSDYRVVLSLPGTDGKYLDAPDQWDAAVAALRQALDASGLPYEDEEGEAAFYGPKADFFASDVLGREWQLSTIQVDFIQPERLGCEYVGEDGDRHHPVVLHRAVTGTTERFLAILIEHYEGNFPAWLAPIQARLIPIADRHIDYANDVVQQLQSLGLRADVDTGNERMNAKVRKGQLEKIPYLLVVGDKEIEAGAVAVRKRGGDDLGVQPIATFAADLKTEADTRQHD